MNKQEAIEELQNMAEDSTYHSAHMMVVCIEDIVETINQIHEPQKVVVPKFVAEWIEYCKANDITLLGALDPISELGEALANSFGASVGKCIAWVTRNQETFARAWLDGYEIEKEKLYTVEIPNPNSKGNNKICLCKDAATGKVYLCKGKFNPSKNKNLQLTEAEIKKILNGRGSLPRRLSDGLADIRLFI
jgi:hypothetical protein